MIKIDVYIKKNEDLLEKYNTEFVSRDLIEYILSKAMYLNKHENISLKLHVTKETKGCSSIIRKGFEEAYYKSIKMRNLINIKQIFLLLLGIFILLLSTLISDENIFHEVILIVGWVPIWEAVQLELLTDTKEKRKRRILKKIMKTNMQEILICNENSEN